MFCFEGDEVQGVRNVAADLILIAHQLEQRVVAKATENLTKKLQTSSVWVSLQTFIL